MDVSPFAMTTLKNLRIGVDVGGQVLCKRATRAIRLTSHIVPTLTESSLILRDQVKMVGELLLGTSPYPHVDHHTFSLSPPPHKSQETPQQCLPEVDHILLRMRAHTRFQAQGTHHNRPKSWHRRRHYHHVQIRLSRSIFRCECDDRDNSFC